MGKTAISITLDSELLEQIKKEAEENDRSLSNYIQMVLKNSIQNEKEDFIGSYEQALKIEKSFKVVPYSVTEAKIVKNMDYLKK